MSIDAFWLSAFLDYPADVHASGAAYWAAVTGYTLSESRGESGEFATPVPPDGDDFLRVQRVADGVPRVHLDLHVADPDAAAQTAVAFGASITGDHGDYWTLASPGGLTFCLVTHPAGTRPRHRASVVDQVCLDIPPSRYDAEFDFWTELTGWVRRDVPLGSEFGRLTPLDDLALQLLVQRLDGEQPVTTAHLDWATTDRDAEAAAHVELGAELVARYDGWTVLRDPAGMLYCLTLRPPGHRTS